MNEARRIVGLLTLASLATLVFAVGWAYVWIMIRPSGPYTPLVEAAYFFNVKGAVRELNFEPVAMRNHEVALISNRRFPVEKQFGGRILVEVFRFGIKTDERRLEEARRSVDAAAGTASSEDISYGEISVWDILPGRAIVRITVLEAQETSAKTADTFRVVVRPSAVL